MGYSEYFDYKRQTWSDPAALAIWERYQQLYSACDFFSAFRSTPQFQTMFPGDFESFGRSMGLDWVFDQTRCPEALVPYIDLLVEPTGCYMTIVPEGAFSFHPAVNEGSWGLVHDTWDVVLGVIEDDYRASKLEGAPSSLRYKRLILLLEQQCIGREVD